MPGWENIVIWKTLDGKVERELGVLVVAGQGAGLHMYKPGPPAGMRVGGEVWRLLTKHYAPSLYRIVRSN